MYKKSVMHVQSCCFAYKTYYFLTFSSPSASLDLKVPCISADHIFFLYERFLHIRFFLAENEEVMF